MTAIDPPIAAPSLSAHIEERILAPMRRNARATRWFAATVLSILALHAGLLVFFLYRDRTAPDIVARQEPTAIEVLVEKPKPPAAKVPPPPKPQARPEIEKPAYSAPRAPNQEKVDTASPQKETHAPKADTPPADGKPVPAKESAASPSADPAPPAKDEESAAKPDLSRKEAEALDKAKPEPKDKPKKVAKLTPRARTKRPSAALKRLAGASNLPDYTFARPSKPSPVSGGTEDSRYLAIVYGMIMQNRRVVDLPDHASGDVTVTFNLDDDGEVIGIGIERTSGYPEIDAAAAAAIRRASPFPPPPAGAPHGLVATIDFGGGQSDYTMGSRAP